jgi:hypothetical protein
MAWKYNNRIIRAGRAWTDDLGFTHPRNWSVWSDELKAERGLVWEDDPAPFDNRFYWGRQADGTLIERSLDDVNETDEDGNPLLDTDGNQVVTLGLKSQYKAQTKVTAGGLLSPTDWYIIRYQEDNTATVPANIATYRAAVRTASGTIEAAIDSAADLNAFIALFDVPVDSEGVPTGNAPINDWPDEV